jgi:hypothetical protein
MKKFNLKKTVDCRIDIIYNKSLCKTKNNTFKTINKYIQQNIEMAVRQLIEDVVYTSHDMISVDIEKIINKNV